MTAGAARREIERGRFVLVAALALLAACAETDLEIPKQAAPAPPPAAAPAPPPPPAPPKPRAPTVEFSADRFVAVASHALAAEAARDVLKAGGSAADAVVAAALVMGVVEPQSSGLGGGGFLLYYDAGKKILAAFDGRETAPESAKPDMFLDAGRPIPFGFAARGGKPVGVPGLVRLLEAAHKDHGKLPWKDLFAPAISHAEDGFAVSAHLNRAIAEATYDLKASREAAALYLDEKGNPRPEGYRLKNPTLAATLRAIADKGADAFYSGSIAEAVIRAVREARHNPAQMTPADLSQYRAKSREPLCLPYRAYRVCSMPPPSSGGLALLQILGLLSAFDLKAELPFSATAVHLIAEASRLAFADREVYVGDPDFVPVPAKGLIAPDYLAERARGISRLRARPKVSPGMPAMGDSGAIEFARRFPDELAVRAGESPRAFDDAPLSGREGDSTAHVSVVDSDGNIAALTASIERRFGSRIAAAGFILNNQLTDFAFDPVRQGGQVANAPAKGKRPRSSMAPTIVFDGAGRPVLALGSPGGPRIIGYVAKTVIAALDWDMGLAAAVRAANVLDRGRGIEIEKGSALESLKASLEAKGHGVSIVELDSGVNAIHIRHGALSTPLLGIADPRREGAAAGE
ncbi:MAG: gamma-glutamyltransferase [Rhodospirillales bacterium]|nr:gamma-glutamyltransferase [Rhodospirillales bacterium]